MDDSLDPKVWIKRAKGNLSRAKMHKTDDQFYEDYCFDCQQCAEKAIKGLIIDL
ncbi:MAG: HEPN domain-containing protein, partial [Spirochaetales bacterium]|nr:HEPN domain-containing protein [Spirochaetales bacterium]